KDSDHGEPRQHDADHPGDRKAQPGGPQLVVQPEDLHRPDPGCAPEGAPGAPAVTASVEIVKQPDDEDIGREIGLVLPIRRFVGPADHNLSKGAFVRPVKDRPAKERSAAMSRRVVAGAEAGCPAAPLRRRTASRRSRAYRTGPPAGPARAWGRGPGWASPGRRQPGGASRSG